MPHPPPREYHLVTDPEQLDELLDLCVDAERFAIDTETTGLNVHEDGFKTVGIVIAPNNRSAYYLPVGHEGFQGTSEPENLPFETIRRFLVDLYGSGSTPIYHNGAYDRSVLKKSFGLDFDFTYGEDTILASHLVDENMPKSLKVRAKKFLGVEETTPKATDVKKEWLEDNLLSEYTYEETAKNGRKYTKTGYKLKADWVERLRRYYLRFATGGTPYKFVVNALMNKAFTAMKTKKVDGVEFKGAWKGDFRYVPPEIAVYYACDDAINTFALWEEYEDGYFFIHPELRKLYDEIELPANDVMMRATYRGMRANRAHLQGMKQTLTRRAEEFREEALEAYGKIIEEAPQATLDELEVAFNEETLLTSNTQLAALIYDVVGFPVVQKTSTGNPSAGKQALSKLLELEGTDKKLTKLGHEFITAKMRFQDVTKLENTYTDSLIEKIDSEGRIHAQYNTVGTVSGRMSSNSPNFQQMPRLTPEEVEKKPWLYGIDVRAAFTSEPGYVYVAADWNSMEMIGAAAVAGDVALKELLSNGRDLHVHTAKNAMKVVYGHLTDEHFEKELGYTRQAFDAMSDEEFKKNFKTWRQDAKVVNFSQTYAGTWWTLHKSFGFPEEKAKMMEEGFKRAYPHLVAKMEATYAELEEKGYITYPEYGFVKRMDKPPRSLAKKDPRGYQRQIEAAKRTCFNALIQGYCAYIAKEALVKVDAELRERGIDGWVSHQIHDELGLQVRVDQAEEAAEILLKHMRRYVDDVFLDADPEIKVSMSKAEASLEFADLATFSEEDREHRLQGLTHKSVDHEEESLEEIEFLHSPIAQRLGEYIGTGVRQL